MQLKQDARVYDASGESVGHISRMVIDPKTKEVTYIVVRQGTVLTEDKVVPIGSVDSADEGGVRLSSTAESFDQLPNFEERTYVPANDYGVPGIVGPAAFYAYPSFGGAGTSSLAANAYAASAPSARGADARTNTNIPEDEVALKRGAHVYTRKGDPVGDIDEVMIQPETNRASHIVVSSGMLFKSRKLVPADWIMDITSDEVHLAVDASTLERVPDYSA